MKTTKPMPPWLRAMVPTKNQSLDRSASPLPARPDLPDPPADIHPRTLDLVRRGSPHRAEAGSGGEQVSIAAGWLGEFGERENEIFIHEGKE